MKNPILDELAVLIDKYEDGSKEERKVAIVLCCIIGAIIEGCMDDLVLRCIDMAKNKLHKDLLN